MAWRHLSWRGGTRHGVEAHGIEAGRVSIRRGTRWLLGDLSRRGEAFRSPKAPSAPNEVEVEVPESYADEIGLEMPVQIRIGTEDFPGAVTAIAPEVIANQVKVRLRFTGEAPASLRQNQRLTARIQLENRPGVLSVQRGAFVDADQGRSAFLVEGDAARRVPIRTGAIGLERVEILDGLKAGDRIIVSDTSEFLQQQSLLLTD